MVPFFSFVATLLTTDFVGCGSLEGKTPNYDSDVFTCRTPTSELDERPPFPGGFPVSPPHFPLKRRARHQRVPYKRLKVSAGAYRSGFPALTKTRKQGYSKPKPSAKLSEVRFPYRTLPSPPISHGGSSTPTTSTEDNGSGPQDTRHAAAGPTSPAAANFAGSWSIIADNVVIGCKRPAAAEFDEDVTVPHRKKYMTSWMSEYIRLRAPSWREMLRAMHEAKWRPFRPQVIRYLAPAPPPAPLYHGYANSTTDHLSVMIPIDSPCSASRIAWADKGKWKAEESPEQVAPRWDQIFTQDPTPAATDILPSSSSSSSLIPPLLDIPPSTSVQVKTHLSPPLSCPLIFPPSPLPLPHDDPGPVEGME